MTSDHGEMLDEAHLGQVYTHGPDVDLPVIRVPMIVAGTGQFQTPTKVVQRRVRLQDIANTVLAAADLPTDLGNGEDLETVWSGTAGPPPAHFAEATRSGVTKKKGKADPDEWPNLMFERAIIHEDTMLVKTPWKKTAPRLYAVDSVQSKLDNPDLTSSLEASLQAWDATAPNTGAKELDAETEAALRALGYLE
jgi:arylsulfatase A-like enzyme